MTVYWKNIICTLNERLEETVETLVKENMNKLEFNIKMEQEMTNNERIINYVNTQINYMVVTVIQHNLGSEIK